MFVGIGIDGVAVAVRADFVASGVFVAPGAAWVAVAGVAVGVAQAARTNVAIKMTLITGNSFFLLFSPHDWNGWMRTRQYVIPFNYGIHPHDINYYMTFLEFYDKTYCLRRNLYRLLPTLNCNPLISSSMHA